MKLVINTEYGGFSIPEPFCKKYGLSPYDHITRNDERLVNFVGEDGYEIWLGFLEVVEIPDNATDYFIDEYDGLERVIYVVDGKLHWTE